RAGGHLEASAHGRMERLLRQTGVLAGLLFNGQALRLLSAPRRESSGWLDFRVSDMVQTAGRPISTALRLLLGQPRLLSLPRAQLLVLFRMIHDGAESGAMRLPKRHGVLFDPDRFKFLEGRPIGGARQIHERIDVPVVPDGTIYRALEKLLVLDGERISYRAL